MQSSQTTEDFSPDKTESKQHTPVKHVRSHDNTTSNHQLHVYHGRYRKNRSLSAGFRHSIRNLTSCALVR